MKIPMPQKKTERTDCRIPKSSQQSIPIRYIYKDGIWNVGGKYSRTWRFTDINYSVADDGDKREMLILYCALEKALPTDAITKISIVNKRINQKEFQSEMLIPERYDTLDPYRKEYNGMMRRLTRSTSTRITAYTKPFMTGSAPCGKLLYP